MKIITGISEIKDLMRKERSKGRIIGFVPTMGYFHHGHEALMQKARQENDVLVISVFVNPCQFSANEDFDSYPRDSERDSEIAQRNKTDYLFAPRQDEIYPVDFQTSVKVGKLEKLLCGKSRTGHFKGVATIVLKLFNIIQPDRAYFGLKDYQQFRVIERMVKDLNLQIILRPVDTVRDEDGLAASSRNSYLTYDEREQATVIYESLVKAQVLFRSGISNSSDIINEMKAVIDKRPLVKIEYIDVVDKNNLESLDKIKKGQTLIALAAKVGKARLIDNIVV